MNQIISWLQSVRVRFIGTIFIVGFALFLDAALGYDNQLQALAAKPLTPEATSYQVDETSADRVKDRTENGSPVENSQNKLKGIADNLREKLNLDEPTPPSTKKFFKQVEEKVDEVTEPITGK